MSISYRPLTEEERRAIGELSSRSEYKSIVAAHAFVSIPLLCIIFGVLSCLWVLASFLFGWPEFETFKWQIALVSGATTLVVIVWFSWKAIREVRSPSSAWADADKDLRDGVAATETLKVVEAVEIEELDDEGAGFLLSLSDGRVLCVIGQEFYPYAHDPKPDPDLLEDWQEPTFPHDLVEYIYAPKSGIMLGIKGVGSFLEPRSRVRWISKGPRAKPYTGPPLDSFSDGPINDLILRSPFEEHPLRSTEN